MASRQKRQRRFAIFTKRNPVAGKFKVRSLESINTIAQDCDVGVVRVCGPSLAQLGGRNVLVRISVEGLGGREKSLIRIVRAATGTNALKKDEIALQYDDRELLGIKAAGTEHNVRIEQVSQILNQPSFLWNHTSPLVRMNAYFAVVLTLVGTMLGLLVGGLIGGL